MASWRCSGRRWSTEGTVLRCSTRLTQAGERQMETPQAHPRFIQGVRRRELLKAGLAAGVALSAGPFSHAPALWAAAAGQPKRGGILRVRGYDPPHFDHHQTISFK